MNIQHHSIEEKTSDVSYAFPRRKSQICYLPRHNFFIDLNRLVREERWITGRHFINEDSKRPPVDSFIVAFRQNDFRGKVFRSAAKRPGTSLDTFGETKIGYLKVSKVDYIKNREEREFVTPTYSTDQLSRKRYSD